MYLTATHFDDIKILNAREEKTHHFRLDTHATQRKTSLKYLSALCFVFGEIPDEEFLHPYRPLRQHSNPNQTKTDRIRKGPSLRR